MCVDRKFVVRVWVELGFIMVFGECDNMKLNCEGFFSEECFYNVLIFCFNVYFVL